MSEIMNSTEIKEIPKLTEIFWETWEKLSKMAVDRAMATGMSEEVAKTGLSKGFEVQANWNDPAFPHSPEAQAGMIEYLSRLKAKLADKDEPTVDELEELEYYEDYAAIPEMRFGDEVTVSLRNHLGVVVEGKISKHGSGIGAFDGFRVPLPRHTIGYEPSEQAEGSIERALQVLANAQPEQIRFTLPINL